MQSRASFFSPAIYRKNLTRFMPLWLAYLALWLVLLPLGILTHRNELYFTSMDLRRSVLALATQGGTLIIFGYAILVAMALHGWYYKSANVNALAALPIRREGWFFTNLLTALTAALVPNLIAALLGWAAASSMGLAGGVMLEWLAIVSLLFLFFYALATLCAALVGQILALPVLYGLMNFTAIVINYVTAAILSTFVYGMHESGIVVLLPLSPAAYLLTHSPVSTAYEYAPDSPVISSSSGFADAAPAAAPDGFRQVLTSVSFAHWGYLLGLAVAAVVLLAAAFLFFRCRRMAAAGDVIAVRPLRPVFKYCFAAGCALVLGSLVAFVFFDVNGGPSLAVMILCLLAGGMIGYFTAEILLKKTFRVFGREWIGYGVFTLCLVAAMLLMEFDVTGYERRVPRLDDVATVNAGVGMRQVVVDDPALLSEVLALHQTIVQDKGTQEAILRQAGTESAWFLLTYTLRDGSLLQRAYTVCANAETWKNTGSPARRLSALLNRPAMVLSSCAPDFPVEGPQNISWANLNNEGAYLYQDAYGADPDAEYAASSLSLSQEDAYELYTTCFLPDLREGKIGREDFYGFDSSGEDRYTANLDFRFVKEPEREDSPTDWCSAWLTPGSRTAQYFLDRGLLLITQAEADELSGRAYK